MTRLLARLRSFMRWEFTRRQFESNMEMEIRFHLQSRTEDLIRSGLSPDQAARQARLEFGGIASHKDSMRASVGLRWLDDLWLDLRYALRQLRHSPGFAFTAVLTLTMAITANVVVFGVLNALVLHPLPVPEANRVIQVQRPNGTTLSYPDYRDIRDRNRTFSDLAVYRLARIGFDISGEAQPVWGYEVSGNYFDMLGVKPALGRFLRPSDDEKKNGAQNVVLSYACWQVRFSGDPHIIGKTVRLNKIPYTVIGVAPKNFNGTEYFFWPELWVPVQNEAQIEGYDWLDQRWSENSWDVGRLKAGVTVAQAGADLERIAAELGKEHPDADKHLALKIAQPGFLGDALGGPVHAFLYGLMGMALLVLLAACANLGGLFAARTADRARELGIRIAIGCSRKRILRQLLTESGLLAAMGGAAACLIASLLLRALAAWHPGTEIPVQFLVGPDATTIIFAALIACITGLLFSIIPVRQALRTDTNQVLKPSGTSPSGGRRLALRDLLLAVQIALCCLLVTASFVALRGLQRSLRMPLGFEPDGVVLATMDVHLAGYERAQAPALQERLLNAAASIPGVRNAAYADTTPLSLDQNGYGIFPPGTADFSSYNVKFIATPYSVSPGYFATTGTRLFAGREFSNHDDERAPRVAIVNETFARKLFGVADVVGKSFPLGPSTQVEVVGVVEDGKYETLTEDSKAAVFWPILQQPSSDTVLIVRSSRAAAEMIPALKRAIAGVEPKLPVFNAGKWSDGLYMVMFPARAATIALGILGGLSLMLAVTGIFGMASYAVSKRMRELGIRVALGAQRNHVLRTALGRTLMLLAIGSVAGLVLGIAASRVLASIVYQASASDPWVILASTVTMCLVGMMSAAVPASRVLLLDPTRLLRDE
jgi:predicted permease